MRGGALDAIYGAPLEGRSVVPAPPDLAPILAAAHHRVHRSRAGVHAGDGAVVDQDGRPEADDAPLPPADRRTSPPEGLAEALGAAAAPLVLVGPGVILADAVPGLHALAAQGSLGVLNSWGAKGVFDWRSRHHLATVGLQARDLELAGVPEADLVVAAGLDEAELPSGWRTAAVVEVASRALGPLAERVARPRTEIAVPALRAELARVTQAGWQATVGPLPPTKVTQHYGSTLGAGGLVAADPGLPGYWVARTLPTTGLGGALVPADAQAVGFAIAAAIVARFVDPARAVLAVTGPLTGRHQRLLELAQELGVPVAVEVWDDGGPALDAEAHERRLIDLLATGGTASIATDPGQLAEMEAVAGPIVAWRRRS